MGCISSQDVSRNNKELPQTEDNTQPKPQPDVGNIPPNIVKPNVKNNPVSSNNKTGKPSRSSNNNKPVNQRQSFPESGNEIDYKKYRVSKKVLQIVEEVYDLEGNKSKMFSLYAPVNQKWNQNYEKKI